MTMQLAATTEGTGTVDPLTDTWTSVGYTEPTNGGPPVLTLDGQAVDAAVLVTLPATEVAVLMQTAVRDHVREMVKTGYIASRRAFIERDEAGAIRAVTYYDVQP